MRVEVADAWPMWFADGAPVRAASGLARYGAGWLVVQDDSTHACLWESRQATAIRLLPAVEGLDLFDEPSGTKDLKPDLEAAVSLPDGSVLALGSGSTPARMRSAHLSPDGVMVVGLAHLYARIAAELGVPADQLNLEGACLVGNRLRWFQRGLPAAGAATASVDLHLATLLRDGDAGILDACRYDLGTVDGVGLAVTDAVTLPDGRVLLAVVDGDDPLLPSTMLRLRVLLD